MPLPADFVVEDIPDQSLLVRARAALDAWEARAAAPTSSVLGTGAIAAFEAEMAARLGTRHALALPSGTLALRVGLQVLGVGPGDEVVVPAYDWTAAAAATSSLGAVPVAADVELPGCGIDPAAVADALTASTAAVVVTHLLGVPADVVGVRAVCDPRGIPVVEDCCQALGAVVDGRPVGSFGRVSVASIGPGKIVDGGEGGVLATGCSELFRQAVGASQHPARQLLAGLLAPAPGGLDLRLHPLAAVLALDGIDQLDGVLRHRRRHLQRLRDLVAAVPGVEPPGCAPADCVGATLPVMVTGTAASGQLQALGVDALLPGQVVLRHPIVLRRRPALNAETADARIRCLVVERAAVSCGSPPLARWRGSGGWV